MTPEGVVPGALEPGGGSSSRPTTESRSSQTAACSSSPEPPRAVTSCAETVQRFARHLVLSRGVACQLSLCRRSSSRRLYQHGCARYHRWCSEKGHSVFLPTVLKIADFLLSLRVEKRLCVPTIRGYPSILSAVFEFCLPGLQDNFILRDLVCSFELERLLRPVSPAWDLVEVLSFLRSLTFEPLSSRPLRVVTMKVAFLLSLATARRVGELQAVSFWVVFQENNLIVILFA